MVNEFTETKRMRSIGGRRMSTVTVFNYCDHSSVNNLLHQVVGSDEARSVGKTTQLLNQRVTRAFEQLV